MLGEVSLGRCALDAPNTDALIPDDALRAWTPSEAARRLADQAALVVAELVHVQ